MNSMIFWVLSLINYHHISCTSKHFIKHFANTYSLLPTLVIKNMKNEMTNHRVFYSTQSQGLSDQTPWQQHDDFQ